MGVQNDNSSDYIKRLEDENAKLREENQRLKQTIALLESDLAKSGLFSLSTEREKRLQRAIEEIYQIVSVYQYG